MNALATFSYNMWDCCRISDRCMKCVTHIGADTVKLHTLISRCRNDNPTKEHSIALMNDLKSLSEVQTEINELVTISTKLELEDEFVDDARGKDDREVSKPRPGLLSTLKLLLCNRMKRQF